MEVYIGLDVSLASAAICVLGDKGEMVTEAQVASAPDALVSFLRELPHGIAAIGLEAGPLSNWLHKGLTDAGFETVLMETRQVKAALKAMPIKTDRRDAEGIARLSSDGLVPAGALQDGVVPGDACAAELAQVGEGRDHRHGTLAAGRAAQLRAQARPGLEGPVRGARPGVDRRQRDAGRGGRTDPSGAAGSAPRAGRAREAGPQSGRRGSGMPPLDDHARRRPGRGADVRVGGRRSRAVPKIQGRRPLGGADAETEPVRRTRYRRRDHQRPGMSACARRSTRRPR